MSRLLIALLGGDVPSSGAVEGNLGAAAAGEGFSRHAGTTQVSSSSTRNPPTVRHTGFEGLADLVADVQLIGRASPLDTTPVRVRPPACSAKIDRVEAGVDGELVVFGHDQRTLAPRDRRHRRATGGVPAEPGIVAPTRR